MSVFRRILCAEIRNVLVSELEHAAAPGLQLSSDLMKRASLREFEQVQVWHGATGQTFDLSVTSHPGGGNPVLVKGPLAKFFRIGDDITIQSFGYIPAMEATEHYPVRIAVDESEQVTPKVIRLHGPLFYSAQKTV